MEKLLLRQWRRIMETPVADVKPVPGPQCWEYDGCPVKACGKCPLYDRKGLDVLVKTDTVEGMARAARALSDQTAAIVSRLKAKLEEKAAVDVDGKPVGFRVSTSRRYPVVALLELAKTQPVNLADAGLAETAAVKACGGKKTLNKNAALESALQRIAEEKKTTKFVYR